MFAMQKKRHYVIIKATVNSVSGAVGDGLTCPTKLLILCVSTNFAENKIKNCCKYGEFKKVVSSFFACFSTRSSRLPQG